MRTYVIQLERTEYATVTVEAEDSEHAWQKLDLVDQELLDWDRMPAYVMSLEAAEPGS